MSFYYQPGGEKGIIRWSSIIILFCLGIIIQFEIWKFNILSTVIITISLILTIFLILRSKITVNKNTITIQNTFKKEARIINLDEVASIEYKKFHFVVKFKSKEFFPLKLVTTNKNIKNLNTFLR